MHVFVALRLWNTWQQLQAAAPSWCVAQSVVAHITHAMEFCFNECSDAIATPTLNALLRLADARIVYTFDVYWEESDISWASRWDAYLNMPGGRVHWFSILNSLMVVLVMSSIVAMIMMRTIRRDLQRYEGLLGDASNALPC